MFSYNYRSCCKRILLFVLFISLQKPAFAQDSLAAVKLYNYTDGANWVHNDNWLSNRPLNEWYGLTVNDTNIVTIKLPLNHLSGKIPEEIGYLTSLKLIDISNNNLFGTVPESFSELKNIEQLDLSRNELSGEVLPIISDLRELKILNISKNEFIGQIPKQISNINELVSLDISDNSFHGDLPINIFRLQKLTRLDLHGNYFSGNIPRQIGTLIQMTDLDLSRNNFSGTIPKEIGKLINLKERLALDHNQFSGTLPKEICSLFKLENLWLNNNQFNGIIPFEIGKLTNIKSLFIYQNNFVGPLPKSIGSLRNLEIFYAQDNSFGGSVPNELWFMPKLKMLKLENNQLSGSIPGDLRILQSVQSIDISNNFISAIADTIALPSTMLYYNLTNNKLYCDSFEISDITSSDLRTDKKIVGLESQNCDDKKLFSFSIEKHNIDFEDVSTDSSSRRIFWIASNSDSSTTLRIQNFNDNFILSDSLINIENNDTIKVTLTFSPIESTAHNDVVLISDPTNSKYGFITIFGQGIEANMPERDKSVPWSLKLHPVAKSDTSDAVIKYDIPQTSTVNISVYNLGGRPIKTLVDGSVDVGFNEIYWDYSDANGKEVEPGEYLIVMQSGMFIQIQPVLIIY